jgi:adenine-specific DNA methylase
VTPLTQAVELLPTAYVFLRAVLEYPKEFGERLVKDVERWGRWVTHRLREDPDVKGLYDKGDDRRRDRGEAKEGRRIGRISR